MQAVLLAAGKSTRTYPLTLTMPKPLLKVANKTLLEHNLDNLNGLVDEVIIIVGYKKELIQKKFGNKYKNLKISYITQKEQLGTAHALYLAKSRIKGKFILMMGDDIYSKKDITKCLKYNYSVLVQKVKNPEIFGVIKHKNHILVDFVEKPKVFVSNLANTALYVIDKKIFPCIEKIGKSERGELEMPDAIKLLSNENQIHCIESTKWIPIGYPWDIQKADNSIRNKKNIIGKNSKIYGDVKNSSIGNNCKIYGTVKNSVIMDGTVVSKNSIVENSVIGNKVKFDGIILSSKNTFSSVNGNKIKIRDFGAVIADNSVLKNVTISSGCKIWPGMKSSNTRIKKDLQ